MGKHLMSRKLIDGETPQIMTEDELRALGLWEEDPLPIIEDHSDLFPEVEHDLEEKIIYLDDTPADNGKQKSYSLWTQDICWQSEPHKLRMMASMSDCYRAFNDLKRNYDHGTGPKKEEVNYFLAELRKDFNRSAHNHLLLTDTLVTYSPKINFSEIVHHPDSYQPRYIKNLSVYVVEKKLNIPVYRGKIIIEVTADHLGLTYLRALFDTEDDAEKIMGTLEFVSNLNRNNIRVWTASIKGALTRKNFSTRVAGFDYSANGFFNINADYEMNTYGRARGKLFDNS